MCPLRYNLRRIDKFRATAGYLILASFEKWQGNLYGKDFSVELAFRKPPTWGGKKLPKAEKEEIMKELARYSELA